MVSQSDELPMMIPTTALLIPMVLPLAVNNQGWALESGS
jgi:hypothetical protein